MKKTIFTLLITILAGLLFTSCQKQCNCYDYDRNIRYTGVPVYSKKECIEAKDDPYINPYGDNMECFYEDF